MTEDPPLDLYDQGPLHIINTQNNSNIIVEKSETEELDPRKLGLEEMKEEFGMKCIEYPSICILTILEGKIKNLQKMRKEDTSDNVGHYKNDIYAVRKEEDEPRKEEESGR